MKISPFSLSKFAITVFAGASLLAMPFNSGFAQGEVQVKTITVSIPVPAAGQPVVFPSEIPEDMRPALLAAMQSMPEGGSATIASPEAKAHPEIMQRVKDLGPLGGASPKTTAAKCPCAGAMWIFVVIIIIICGYIIYKLYKLCQKLLPSPAPPPPSPPPTAPPPGPGGFAGGPGTTTTSSVRPRTLSPVTIPGTSLGEFYTEDSSSQAWATFPPSGFTIQGNTNNINDPASWFTVCRFEPGTLNSYTNNPDATNVSGYYATMRITDGTTDPQGAYTNVIGTYTVIVPLDGMPADAQTVTYTNVYNSMVGAAPAVIPMSRTNAMMFIRTKDL